MSLINRTTLRVLYNLAIAPNDQEHEAITFWEQLFNKVYFPEEHFVVAQQKPPSTSSEDRRRRFDINICVVSSETSQLDIIAVVEGKKHGSQPAQIGEVESQAFEACQSRCKHGHGV
jgi:hypothetical protein